MKEYVHRPRGERLKEIIIGQSIVALAIILISIYLVFWGFGYKINWQTMKISHTGIIYLSFDPKNANVTVSGQNVASKSPYDIQLLPGYYEVSVSANGYYSWQRRISVKPDRVEWLKGITLFKTAPEISAVSDQDTISSIDAPYDLLIKNPEGDLAYNDHEIWVGDTLVTRLSNKVSDVIWYPGSEYLAYQQSDEIRMVEKDGSNDVLLVKLSSSDKSSFIFSWDGSSLLYKDGVVYKRAKIK